ncbi:MAG: zinc ABC transporter substrate-binding protein [Lentisphaeria bacterium]|jgi:zinc transport system substrate-binding protein|nr:zinc ABC transporter substrate-binding protein [Lentisphaeria bacterium]
MRNVALALVLAVLSTACKQETPPAAGGGPVRVSVSIPPLVSVVRAIGGDLIEVSSLMSEGDDPHTFSPTPQAISSLRAAHLFFTVGVDYEKAVCDKIEPMFPQLHIVNVAISVDKLAAAEHEHEAEHGDAEHHHHEEHLSDPHVWLSLPNLIAVAEQVKLALQKDLPEKSEVFAERFAAYRAQLESRHREFAEQLQGLATRSFCVYHPVFGYFARDYDLEQHVVEVDGKTPTPRQLRILSEEAKEENFKVIFVQPQFTERPAQAIAELIGGTVTRVNPLAENPLVVLTQAVDALASQKAK